MFPNTTIVSPAAFFRTQHGVDPLSYMAYSTEELGFTDALFTAAFKPLAAPSCPHSPRVWFAGEAACRAFNGYTHAALDSGRDTAMTVLHHLGLGPKPSPSICSRDLCP